tara:strand:- start:132 stop:572 length:441 start_codon:yes stop_codon:yes gene_type:complete
MESYTVDDGPSRELHPEGVFQSVIVDRWQYEGTNNATGEPVTKEVFVFETSAEMADGKPYHISKFVRVPAKSFNPASNLYKFAKNYDGLDGDGGGFTPEKMIGKKFWIQVDHSECGRYDNLGEKPVKMSDPLTITPNPEFVRKADR